jgi:hypothetical protein
MGLTVAPETTGGWASIANILEGIGKGADFSSSSFFPTPQYNTIRSDTVERAGADGLPYRQTTAENQSMIETDWWARLGWVGSPYEDSNAIPVKVAESKGLDQSVSATKSGPVETTDWGDWGRVAETGVMLYDKIKDIFSPRETVEGEPRAGTIEGRNEQQTNIDVNRSADVITTAKGFYDQVKGLFGLGYPQTEPQPAAPVQHEAKQAFYANQQVGVSNKVLLMVAVGAYLLLK